MKFNAEKWEVMHFGRKRRNNAKDTVLKGKQKRRKEGPGCKGAQIIEYGRTASEYIYNTTYTIINIINRGIEY